MADSFQKLKELDLSRDEVERIGEALKKEEFRKLLVDYVQEVQDPENRRIYQEEIVQLEKERGVEATFINPEPGYVIKTSADGSKKCFVNICSNENVAKPTSTPALKDGAQGLHWSLPHSLTPPREDVDNKGFRCVVYDVVFHPNTLHLASRNKAFYNMVNTTACDAIESHFNATLDKKNLKFPKLKYKGLPHSSIVRKPISDYVAQPQDPTEKEFYDKIYAQTEPPKSPKKAKKPVRKTSMEDRSSYTTPKYVIKHRSHVDIQEFVEDKHAKLNSATPKELIVEINLPLIKGSSDITLDVTEKTVQLVSENPSKYKLNLTLPYRVNQDNGNAKFDKDLKKLLITLPVRKSSFDYGREDSGVESDHGSVASPESEEDKTVSDISDDKLRTSFLDDSCHYELPEFTCHLFESTLAFTLNVKNVDEASLGKLITSSSLHIKFASVSSSYYSANYTFYLKFPSFTILEDNVQIEVWDNNVIVQIPVKCNSEIRNYLYGLNDKDLKEKFIEEPTILNNILQDTILEEPEPQPQDAPVYIPEQSLPISTGASCESSSDELSLSYSPSKSRGILKRLSNRAFAGRSISESSLDDYVASSFDSTIPEDVKEDEEMSTSLKKTVRFNDVIKRQLYRSNSSILGQKKKNQRKARNKKRAQERRHSESEASEVEDKKDDGMFVNNNDDYDDEEDKSDDFISDIFQMEIGC